MKIAKSHYKIAIVAPTPFYYHTPLYCQLAKAPEIDLTVYYCSDETVRGIDVEKMYRTKGQIVEEEDLLRGYNYKFLKNYSPFSSYMRWPFGLINLGIWREIKEGKYDAVVLQSWANLTWWLAFLACLKFNTPVFFMTDSNILSEQLKSKLKISLKEILLGKFLFKRAAGFLASGTVNKQFYKAYGVPEKKMVRLPHWWGYEQFLIKAQKLKPERENLRKSFGLKKNDLLLLFVGRLAKEKSLHTLLDAYNRVSSQNKKLFFVGDGPLRLRLEKYIRDFKIQEVYPMGFQAREALLNFYTMADALVLPSREEPWGMVVNEAMCFGLPIIASNQVGAAVDLVKEGHNGFLFPAGDSKKLVTCIEKLINLPSEERLLFGKRSIEIITEWINKIDPVQQILKAIKITNSANND